MTGERCRHCPADGDVVCPYQLWLSGCPSRRVEPSPDLDRHLASVRRQLAFVGPAPTPTAKQIVGIETCDFRRSTCGCLSVAAQCLQAGFPSTVGLADCLDCLTRHSPD